MLYIIFKKGIQDEDRRKLLDHSRVGPEDSNAITNLAMLGVQLTKTSKDKKKASRKSGPKARADDVPYELSRYVPTIKRVMEDHITGAIDPLVFPFTQEQLVEPENQSVGAVPVGMQSASDKPAPQSSYKSGSIGTSLRSNKASWSKKSDMRGEGLLGHGYTGSGSGMSQLAGKSGGGTSSQAAIARAKSARLIVFVAGGLTYSELRSVYEVANALNREVFIGSTHMLVPKQFIQGLRTLRSTPSLGLDISETQFASSSAHDAASIHDSGDRRSGTHVAHNLLGRFAPKKK